MIRTVLVCEENMSSHGIWSLELGARLWECGKRMGERGKRMGERAGSGLSSSSRSEKKSAAAGLVVGGRCGPEGAMGVMARGKLGPEVGDWSPLHALRCPCRFLKAPRHVGHRLAGRVERKLSGTTSGLCDLRRWMHSSDTLTAVVGQAQHVKGPGWGLGGGIRGLSTLGLLRGVHGLLGCHRLLLS